MEYRLADVGRGHGASTIIMAEAFPSPNSSASTAAPGRSSECKGRRRTISGSARPSPRATALTRMHSSLSLLDLAHSRVVCRGHKSCWAHPAPSSVYSYLSAASTFNLLARRAGRIAAISPAMIAAITNTTSVVTGIVKAAYSIA